MIAEEPFPQSERTENIGLDSCMNVGEGVVQDLNLCNVNVVAANETQAANDRNAKESSRCPRCVV
jgi:hypothetical protein